AVLVNPNNKTTAESTVQDVQAAAPDLGLQVQLFSAGTIREIDAVFASLARHRLDALFVAPDPFFSSRRMQLALESARHAVPATYSGRHGGRRDDELRNERRGCVASARRLCRPHPERREARGPSGGPGEQIRVGAQRSDRADARP